MNRNRIITGYLDKEDIEGWGSKLCNSYCMPAMCVRKSGKARIKVEVTMEVLSEDKKIR